MSAKMRSKNRLSVRYTSPLSNPMYLSLTTSKAITLHPSLANAAEAESLAAGARRAGTEWSADLGAEEDSVLFARALGAGTGAVLGPEENADGWAVARVVAVLPGRGRSFAEVRDLVGRRWYGEEGERWTSFEIDPVVVRVARDPAYFTYLRDAPARPEVVVGDGRLELERVANGAHDLLVLDAFSSDAIPVHLLTVEALGDAMRTVAPDGLLAVHLSNRYYDLAPAVAAAARDLGLTALRRSYAPTPAGTEMGATASLWVVLARDPTLVAPLAAAGWAPVPVDGIAPITDDRPDILRFLFVTGG
jgi:hypothetical protein